MHTHFAPGILGTYIELVGKKLDKTTDLEDWYFTNC